MMTRLECFKAVCAGERPDYVPIFGLPGSPGVSEGCMAKTHQRLVATGMPGWVDGCFSLGGPRTNDKWSRYWGTLVCEPIHVAPYEQVGPGIKSTRRVEGEYEVIEYETGAVTRQLLDNAVTYAMPHFVRRHVRDRESWELYKKLSPAPGRQWSKEKIDEFCRPYETGERTRPLAVRMGGTWSRIRGLMGPLDAATILYEDPEMAHEMIDSRTRTFEERVFSLIERLKPDILMCGEDNCYKQGMMITPEQFREFCAPYYRKLGALAKAVGVSMSAVDSDGNVMGLCPLLAECGMNALGPFEVKAGNDLPALRERLPDFIMIGGIEKEVLNEGAADRIESEIVSKVPALLDKGRYFPNADHGIQPMACFDNMRRFMTLLHELTNNPNGEYPRLS